MSAVLLGEFVERTIRGLLTTVHELPPTAYQRVRNLARIFVRVEARAACGAHKVVGAPSPACVSWTGKEAPGSSLGPAPPHNSVPSGRDLGDGSGRTARTRSAEAIEMPLTWKGTPLMSPACDDFVGLAAPKAQQLTDAPQRCDLEGLLRRERRRGPTPKLQPLAETRRPKRRERKELGAYLQSQDGHLCPPRPRGRKCLQNS